MLTKFWVNVILNILNVNQCNKISSEIRNSYENPRKIIQHNKISLNNLFIVIQMEYIIGRQHVILYNKFEIIILIVINILQRLKKTIVPKILDDSFQIR